MTQKSLKLFGLNALGVFLATVCSSALGQETVTWKEDVRGWYIGVDRTIGDGCYMYAGFEGGSNIRVGFNPERESLQFLIGNDDWKSIEGGKKYPIEVKFGSQSPWTGDATGFEWDGGERSLLLEIPLDGDAADLFVREMQQMPNVSVKYEGRAIANLSLKGTYAALAEVMNCQVEVLDNSEPSTSSDPFSRPTSPSRDPFQ